MYSLIPTKSEGWGDLLLTSLTNKSTFLRAKTILHGSNIQIVECKSLLPAAGDSNRIKRIKTCEFTIELQYLLAYLVSEIFVLAVLKNGFSDQPGYTE